MKQKGFSLIELMIVVVIIGILAVMVVPSFNHNAESALRTEGMTEILEVMRAQENFYVNRFTYTTDLTEINYNAVHTTRSQAYRISASECAGGLDLTECVLLTGLPINNQARDGILTLDSRGNRTHNGAVGWPNQ